MGRKKSDNPREIAVTIHLSDEEYNLIKKYSEINKFPISTLIREATIHMLKRIESRQITWVDWLNERGKSESNN